jgi:hypothetical protein
VTCQACAACLKFDEIAGAAAELLGRKASVNATADHWQFTLLGKMRPALALVNLLWCLCRCHRWMQEGCSHNGKRMQTYFQMWPPLAAVMLPVGSWHRWRSTPSISLAQVL